MLKIGTLYKIKLKSYHLIVDFYVNNKAVSVDLVNKPMLYLGEEPHKEVEHAKIGYKFLIDGNIGYFPYRTTDSILVEEMKVEEE